MEDDSKQVKSGVRRRPPAAGRGRKRGSKNKIPASIKAMVLEALNNLGGVKYLEIQAMNNPTAFLSLLGRLIPQEVEATVEGEVRHEGVIVLPEPFKTISEWQEYARSVSEKNSVTEGGNHDRIA